MDKTINKNSVLVVDDQEINVLLLTNILEPDYTVYTANNGHDAIQTAKTYLPDIILLDIVMPGMDGFEALKALKSFGKTQNIPVILITGRSGEVDEERGLALGAADYITKPFFAEIVKLRLQNQIKLIEQFRIMAQNEIDARRYKSILDAIPLPVTVTDANMVITFVNKALEEFAGKKRGLLIGRPCSDRNIHQFCGTADCGMTCAKRGQKRTFFNHEYSSCQADFEVLLDEIGGAAGYIEVVQDITNVQLLAKQRMESEMTNQAKSTFLANMSHEIRTPMNAIMGVTDVLMQSENLPADIEEGLDKIYISCDLLLGIINDILDFSKIEAGKMDIIPAGYKVANLINDSMHLNMIRIEDRPIVFELQIDESIPANLIGDELRIKQILNNLLSNAFKFTDTGKVTLSVDFERKPRGWGTLVLSVRDTGHGMSEGQLQKLFDEYSRFNVRTIQGTGLGMAITKRLITLMDGDISVESTLGTGTLFTVRLPQNTEGAETLGKEQADSLRHFRFSEIMQRKKAQIARHLMPYARVLIVDDVETNHYVVAGLLKPYKLQIDTAISGHSAINKIEAGGCYDLVFMDHMMPEMDGIETTKRLRDWGYTAPIIALTANAVTGQADMFLKNGFDAFISKPIDIRYLNTILNKFIRDRQPKEIIEAARRQISWTGDGENGGSQPQTDSQLLESFINDAHRTVETLEKLCENGEIETGDGLSKFTVAMHGIKRSLLNIDEKELSVRACRLEMGGRGHNTGMITGDTPEFLKGLRALIEKLESGRDNGAADPPEGKKQAAGKAAARLLDRKINGIDIIKGLERYENDEETYLKILRSYTVNIGAMINSIEDVPDKDKLANYEITVHGIKSASFDIFAVETGQTAKELEAAAENGDFDYVGKHNPAFIKNTRKLISELEAALQAIDIENPKPQKDKPDADILAKLLAACRAFDMDGADSAIAEIEKYRYTSDYGLSDWLRRRVDVMDFEKIINKLSALSVQEYL